MRVKDFKITKGVKQHIQNLSWDFNMNGERLLKRTSDPFGTGNRNYPRPPFPKGYSDYLKRYKNIEHYILETLKSTLSLGRTLSSCVDKKNVNGWQERIDKCNKLIEDAKSKKRNRR